MAHRYTMSIASGPDALAQAMSAQGRKGKVLNGWVKMIVGLISGAFRGGQVDACVDDGTGGTAASVNVLYSSSSGAQTIAFYSPADTAGGIVSMSSGSGAVGCTVGGKLVTVTWATSDAASCAALAAAINADTTANTYVRAVANVATGTLTISGGAGTVGGVINGVSVTVTWGTSDTATATALVTAINAKPGLPVMASSSAGVVTIYAMGGGGTGGGGSITLVASGTGVTASGATLSGAGTNANCAVVALSGGAAGLGITLTASGTGVTVATGGNLVAGVNKQEVSVSFTAGASDTATAAAAVAAVNASANMAACLAASSSGAVLTLKALCLPRSATFATGSIIAVTGTGALQQEQVLQGAVNSTDAGFAL